MFIKNNNISPPGGWSYTQEQSGYTMTGITERQLLDRVNMHRNNMGYPTEGILAYEIEDAICRNLSEEDRYEYCSDAPRPWPLLLRPLRALGQPGDRGLGDIVERVIGPVGGDAYKAWYETVFKRSCGCTRRQDNLNAAYPLA